MCVPFPDVRGFSNPQAPDIERPLAIDVDELHLDTSARVDDFDSPEHHLQVPWA